MTRSFGLLAPLLSTLALGCTVAKPPPGLFDSGAGTGGGGNAGDGAAAGGSDAGNGTGGAGNGGGSSGGSGGGGSPTGEWVNVTANLANMDSECGNMSSVSAKPDEDLLIAGVAQKGLWGSTDGGGSWHALGTGSGSEIITNRPSSFVYDPDHPDTWWESGLYNGGGVYRTTDNGLTFTRLGDISHDDVVSVDLTDPDRKTLLAGGHEQPQTLYRSTDGGATWDDVGGGLPGVGNCTYPLVLGGQVHLVGCGGYNNGATGIYRTTNGGQSWTELTQAGGASAPLHASDGSIYWASVNGGGMVRSTDDGQSFEEVTGPGVITSVHPVELPGERIATLAHDHVVVSSDHGRNWSEASATLPFGDAFGITYSAQQKAFFIWHITCGFNGPVPVPADAIMRFDYE